MSPGGTTEGRRSAAEAWKVIEAAKSFEEGFEQVRPGIPVLIISGFAETSDVHYIQEKGNARFMKKPYSVLELGAALADIPRTRCADRP